MTVYPSLTDFFAECGRIKHAVAALEQAAVNGDEITFQAEGITTADPAAVKHIIATLAAVRGFFSKRVGGNLRGESSDRHHRTKPAGRRETIRRMLELGLLSDHILHVVASDRNQVLREIADIKNTAAR